MTPRTRAQTSGRWRSGRAPRPTATASMARCCAWPRRGGRVRGRSRAGSPHSSTCTTSGARGSTRRCSRASRVSDSTSDSPRSYVCSLCELSA